MPRKKPAAKKPANVQVDAHKHVADKRPNIPTRETAEFAKENGGQPFVIHRDRSLDPQLVWKGKDEQDRQPLEVPAVPIYIQEKVHPQAIIDDLLRLGALYDKVVLGSMNRGGLPGTAFEIDDRFTGYNAAAIASAGLDGGKMLLRIDPADPATAGTLEACGNAITDLADRQLIAVIEPFVTERAGDRLANDLSPDAVIRSIAIASGLGATSAYSWLKIPVVDEMERVAEASTLPSLLLGGDVGDKTDEMFDRWRHALSLPGVRGLVAGRNLLYPPDDDVAAVVDIAVSLLCKWPQ